MTISQAGSTFRHVSNVAEFPGHLDNTHEITVASADENAVDFTARRGRDANLSALKDAADVILEDLRLYKCGRLLLPKKINNQRSVWIYQSDSQTAFFVGLCKCGSVWGCPTCAAKISERRREELLNALQNAIALGIQTYHLTLTFPHTIKDDPKVLRKRFARALSVFYNRKSWRVWSKSVGLVGKINTLEIRYGENGWHIHQHILLFVDRRKAIAIETGEVIEARPVQLHDIFPAYRVACVSVGLRDPSSLAVSLQGGENAARYVTKWGFELTKSHVKRGRRGSRSPWDLLRDYNSGGGFGVDREDERILSSAQAAKLFEQYYCAMKGQKQLHWSKGLRALLGIDREKTDQELVNELRDHCTLVGILSEHEWKMIVRRHLRLTLKGVCAEFGARGFKEFIHVQNLIDDS